MTIQTDVEQLVDFINAELPRETWTPWPGGWPNQIEAALIDAVLSIGARYGSDANGVRGAVRRYRSAVGSERPDDLSRLANQDPEILQGILNDQRISGRTKASAIVEAAGNLLQIGVKTAADLNPQDPVQKRAYVSVHGLGWVTWEYLGMLLGKPGIKADRWVVRFVMRALGREVSATDAKSLLVDAAGALSATPTALDHAVWSYERSYEESEGSEKA
ncbi:hypothetical protein [Arthrobacter citreus]|uniref:hypothetical protein n=1 Tax=Arthrobacter citreus TaxID=1670 RepID=UPI0037F91FD7